MANQIDLNKRRANTRLNLFQKMLDELRDQNAANTPTKNSLNGKTLQEHECSQAFQK